MTGSLFDPKAEYGCNTLEAEIIVRAHAAINRVKSKLHGTDFANTPSQNRSSPGDLEDDGLDVPEQVSKLIDAATSSENLAQLFTGWCPYW